MIDFIRIILKPDYGIKIYVNDILLLYICQYLIQRLYIYLVSSVAPITQAQHQWRRIKSY